MSNSILRLEIKARIELYPCDRIPLKPQLWSDFEMNSYLDNYPGGNQINLMDYAAKVGATDFYVGIGEHPNPGQLCQPVKGKDWYTLVAIQNWNTYVNCLYDSAGFAEGVVPGMLIDFEKDATLFYSHTASYVGLATTWIVSFPGIILSSLGPYKGGMFCSMGDIAWNSLAGVMYISASAAYVNSILIVGNGEDRFKRSSVISRMLTDAQRGVQSTISNLTENVIRGPINQVSGLAGINRDGSFLSEIPTNFQSNLQIELELALKLKSLAKFWRVQNAFVVRGSDPCNQSGINGAFDSPEKISYCGDDNIMMNIVRAEKDGPSYDPTIYNAHLAESKYGYSPNLLTTSAWECQKTHGVFEYDACSANNSKNPETLLNDLKKPRDCYFNIPVCDLTQPALQVHHKKKSLTITEICRNFGGLPI
ncbi:hypothetical protein BY996DRAFT_6432813 [Phakopsora pachyrhizi]|nr:hypothetical protein BY996DRAFT_6432813 [Phakopsora pachyrhizi]